ncbi:MAG: porin family protein [Bacteroidota bacterium]
MKKFDNSAENRLKERIVEHEFDFDPQAWKSMNKMLNTHNPRRSPLWLSSLLIMTTIVTLSSIAWYVPFEPIQEFFEEVFEIKEDTIRERPDFVPTEVFELMPESIENPKAKINQEQPSQLQKSIESPVEELPKVGPTDLYEWHRLEVEREGETAKPIATLETYIEESQTVAQINIPVKKKVHAGFFGGGTVAISNSPLIPEGAVSPSIGVFAGYNINDKWGVQVEVNFRKGFVQPFTAKEERTDVINLPIASNSSFDRVSANQDIIAKNLTVLEFPVLGKYKLDRRSSLMAGVRPSWIHVKDPDPEEGKKTIYEKLDVGLSVGYEVQLSKRVAVNLRYNQGVTDLFIENDEVFLNNDFQASVRYTLNP